MENFIDITLILLLLLAIGFGLVLALNRVLKLKNWDEVVPYSITFGLMALVLSVLTWGQFGFSVDLTAVKAFTSILLILSLVLSILFRGEIKNIKRFRFFPLFYLLMIFFIIALGLINYRYLTPAWDHFSYWLVDAKLTYLEGALKSNNEIISFFDYSSFYPIHATLFYLFKGAIFEQYSQFITLLYLMLGSWVAFISFPRKSKVATLSLFLVNSSLIFITLRFYADISTSFYVLLFAVISLKRLKKELMSIKVALLVLISVVLLLIKPFIIPYLLVLWLGYILYDRRRIIEGIKSITKNKSAVITSSALLIFSAVIFLSRIYYTSNIFSPSTGSSVGILKERLFPVTTALFTDALQTLPKISGELYDFYPYLVILILLLAFIILKNRKNLGRDEKYLAAITLLLPLVNITYTLLSGHVSSIARYVTTSVFIFALLIDYSSIHMKRWLKIVLTVFLVGMVITQFISSTWSYRHISKLRSHDGIYLEHTRYASEKELLETVINKCGEDAKVLVAEPIDAWEFGHLNFINTSSNGRIVRYFLMENIDNGDYAYEGVIELLEQMDQRDSKCVVWINAHQYFPDDVGVEVIEIGDKYLLSTEEFDYYLLEE